MENKIIGESMKKLGKMFLMGAVSTLMFASAVDADAMSYEDNPARKLGRGVANTLLGVLEVPIKIADVNNEDGGIAAVTYGTFLGFAHFVARVGVGAFEIVTFPAPMPGGDVELDGNGWGYGPIMTPEFIVDKEHNLFKIVHQDEPGVF